MEEALPEEDAKRYGTDKIESCNVDQIGLDAAWELLRLMEERTKLTKNRLEEQHE